MNIGICQLGKIKAGAFNIGTLAKAIKRTIQPSCDPAILTRTGLIDVGFGGNTPGPVIRDPTRGPATGGILKVFMIGENIDRNSSLSFYLNVLKKEKNK